MASVDRCHSLASLLPPPAALGSLPLATYTHATNKVQEQTAAKMGSLLKQAL